MVAGSLGVCPEQSCVGQTIGRREEGQRWETRSESGIFNYFNHGYSRVGWVLEAIATIHLALEDACLARHNSPMGAFSYSPLWPLSPSCFSIYSFLAADRLFLSPVLLHRYS